MGDGALVRVAGTFGAHARARAAAHDGRSGGANAERYAALWAVMGLLDALETVLFRVALFVESADAAERTTGIA